MSALGRWVSGAAHVSGAENPVERGRTAGGHWVWAACDQRKLATKLQRICKAVAKTWRSWALKCHRLIKRIDAKIDANIRGASKKLQRCAKELTRSCQEVVKKLSRSRQDVVQKLSRRCQEVPKELPRHAGSGKDPRGWLPQTEQNQTNFDISV